MTELLHQAFDKASELSQAEQDALASWILEELMSESRWGQLFASSSNALEKMANEALKEHHAGQTQPLDPDTP